MWVNRLERYLGRFAMPHLTLVLILGQVLFFLMGAGAGGRDSIVHLMELDAGLVMRGEVWRLVTFLFIPPLVHPIFILFAWYLFHLMGTTLENRWGTFRFNLFILIGWLGTAAIAFLPPREPVTNGYLLSSVFLAFAFLFPDFRLLLFFILPVKIKWFALVTWITYFLSFLAGGWTERFAILAATANFLAFFGRDILGNMKAGNRRMQVQAAAIRSENRPRHVCRVCGANNVANPDLAFRYCTDCKPSQCYCPKHLDMHAHTKAAPP